MREAVDAQLDAMVIHATEDYVEEIDLTEELSDDQIQALFDAFQDDDWDEVDAIIDSIENSGILQILDEKAGGLDRNRGGAEKLRRYWTVGVGGAKIRWGTPGDWTRCVSQLSKYLGPRAKGYCALRHKEMNGIWPGDARNKSDSTDDIDTNSIYHESKQNLGNIGEPMLEHKTVGVKGMNVVSADEGIVETIISVTGVVDNVKDRIMPGAYQKTLAKRKPKGVWSHDWDTPVSKTLEVRELMPGDKELPKTMPNGDSWPSGAGALKVKTQFNLETQRGREAYSDVVFFGEEQEWSIGYNVPVGGAKVDSKSGVREITMLELYEYSPVLFGAMPLARTTSVKEAQMALKALKGGAAAWLKEGMDDEEEEVEEYAPVMEDDDEDENEEKAYDLSGDQMILVKTAIQTLSDLLDAVQSETKKFPTPPDDEVEDAPDAMADPMADDDDDYVVMGDEDMSEEDAEMPEEDMYDSLADAIDDLIDDADLRDELIVIADEIDSAMEQEDRDYFESASKAFLDKIEENLGADDEDDLRELAEIIADMIEQMEGDEGEGEEEPEDGMEEEMEDEVPSEDTMDVPEEEIEEDIEEKREFTSEQREEMAGEGTAMPDGSFPIANEEDLRNAIQAHGRAKDIEKAKAHIKKRARALGLTDLIPSEWNEGKSIIDITEIKSLLDDLKS